MKNGGDIVSNENKKMTEEEKQQWDDLYQYVRKEIMQYDENQSLPTGIVLRLKGLTKGKLMANNKTQDYAEYTYNVILNTFKICRPSILRGVSGKQFKDEMSKFIYIAAIVENNINDVYLRMKKAEELRERTEDANLDNVFHKGAEYKRKTQDSTISKKFEDLW